jgi:hypothetical protein
MVKKLLQIFSLLIIIAACVWISWIPLQNLRAQLLDRYFPCEQPIVYSIGTFDPRFGISQADFLSDIAQAKSVWEKPAGRTLFAYATTSGSLKINLVYDYRQEATQKLQKLGLTIDTSQTSYDALKSRYVALQTDYVTKKKILDDMVATYQQTGKGYSQIQQAEAAINSEVDTINALATTLNNLASQLDVTVNQYNQIGQQTVGTSTDGEFDEALYVQDGNGNHIDVYEYTNNDKLVRVLTHELGHALGFIHTDNPSDIMYKVNQSTNIVPTANDIAQLDTKCNIKQ